MSALFCFIKNWRIKETMTKAKEHSTGGTQRIKLVFTDPEMQEIFERHMRPFRLLAQELRNRIYNKKNTNNTNL